MNDRRKEIDILKGIGIVFVIIGHLGHFFDYESLLIRIIYSFHMPLFLMIRGYLFAAGFGRTQSRYRMSADYLQKLFHSLMVPYFVFGLLSIIWAAKSHDFTIYEMAGALFSGDGRQEALVNMPLWFLPMLFISDTIFCGVHSLVVKITSEGLGRFGVLAIVVAVLSLLGLLLMHNSASHHFLWNADVALVMQLFLFFGYVCKRLEYICIQQRERTCTRRNVFIIFLTVIVCLGVWLLAICINGRVDINARKVGNPVLYYLGGFGGTACCYFLSMLIAAKTKVMAGFLEWCGKNSLLIMCIHVPVGMTVYNSGLSKYLPFESVKWCPDIRGVLYILFYDLIIIRILKEVFTPKTKQ